jgi:hypothetical protein
MATKENSTGFLSKMAKFVRNPTVDWSDLDKPQLEVETGYSKVALKEIIERKRQNDFVRRREFDHLRKLRRIGPVVSPDVISRPSFFQTSIASNQDERAMTLRKIDEIEAQMSKQWWKGRQDGVTTGGGHMPDAAPAPLPQVPGLSGSDDAKSNFSSTLIAGMNSSLESTPNFDYDSTQIGQTAPADSALMPPTRPMMAFQRPVVRSLEVGMSEFSTSNLLPVESAGTQTDPELEEAAIRFANGDDAGAEAGLLAALQAGDVAPDCADRWAGALFDLYRATGQQSNFDSVAIDYAMRFGRSAPAWFSIPELLGRQAPQASRSAVSMTDHSVIWACPADLDLQAVLDLQSNLSLANAPWHLHWGALETITPEAAKVLADLFGDWCLTPVTLVLGGVEVLERTLRAYTPPGNRDVALFWWRLRLDALRILRLQDEFELAALDYCVNYEVSPPPWESALCEYVAQQAGVLVAPEFKHYFSAAQGGEDDLKQTFSVASGIDVLPTSLVELNGEILGDAAQALDDLQAGLKGADRLVISCSRLIRVDFSAAGSILNWVAVRESEGCHVQFHEVPRLVAAFFNVIGINEHARVVLRTS